MRCGACGHKYMEVCNIKGESMPFMSITKLTLTRDFHTPKCGLCGNWGLWGSQAEELDKALTLSLCDFYVQNGGEDA